MRRALAARLAMGLILSGCSSTVSSLNRFFGLTEDTTTSNANRAPASTAPAGDNTTTGDAEILQAANADPNASDGGGPNLSAHEFAPQMKLGNDRAQKGYRTANADPWANSGPYNEGSLWNPDSQDNFYFTRNLVYKVGDFITVKLDPDLMESLNSKMASLYAPTKPSVKSVIAEQAGAAAGSKVGAAIEKATGNSAVGAAIGDDIKDRTIASLQDKPRYFTTKEITVRVTETGTRGTVRVEGNKKLFLRSASFDLKFGGVVREDDIGSGRSVASNRVMDSKVELSK